MKRFLPLFLIMTLCGSALSGEDTPSKAPPAVDPTGAIRNTLSSILGDQPSTLLSQKLKHRLSEDLGKPIAVGGKNFSADVPEKGAAWEAYDSPDKVRLVDRFVQQHEKQSLLVTVTVCYTKSDGHMIYFETKFEPVSISDAPVGHRLKL